MRHAGPVRAVITGLRHAQHPQTLCRHGLHRLRHARRSVSRQVAQIHNGLGRALGRHHVGGLVQRGPDMRHGAQLGAQAVGMFQGPVAVQVLGVLQKVLAQAVKGFLHRVKRLSHTGQNGVLHQGVKPLGQAGRTGVVHRQMLA